VTAKPTLSAEGGELIAQQPRLTLVDGDGGKTGSNLIEVNTLGI
jgi:hypothetical protein